MSATATPSFPRPNERIISDIYIPMQVNAEPVSEPKLKMETEIHSLQKRVADLEKENAMLQELYREKQKFHEDEQAERANKQVYRMQRAGNTDIEAAKICHFCHSSIECFDEIDFKERAQLLLERFEPRMDPDCRASLLAEYDNSALFSEFEQCSREEGKEGAGDECMSDLLNRTISFVNASSPKSESLGRPDGFRDFSDLVLLLEKKYGKYMESTYRRLNFEVDHRTKLCEAYFQVIENLKFENERWKTSVHHLQQSEAILRQQISDLQFSLDQALHELALQRRKRSGHGGPPLPETDKFENIWCKMNFPREGLTEYHLHRLSLSKEQRHNIKKSIGLRNVCGQHQRLDASPLPEEDSISSLAELSIVSADGDIGSDPQGSLIALEPAWNLLQQEAHILSAEITKQLEEEMEKHIFAAANLKWHNNYLRDSLRRSESMRGQLTNRLCEMARRGTSNVDDVDSMSLSGWLFGWGGDDNSSRKLNHALHLMQEEVIFLQKENQELQRRLDEAAEERRRLMGLSACRNHLSKEKVVLNEKSEILQKIFKDRVHSSAWVQKAITRLNGDPQNIRCSEPTNLREISDDLRRSIDSLSLHTVQRRLLLLDQLKRYLAFYEDGEIYTVSQTPIAPHGTSFHPRDVGIMRIIINNLEVGDMDKQEIVQLWKLCKQQHESRPDTQETEADETLRKNESNSVASDAGSGCCCVVM